MAKNRTWLERGIDRVANAWGYIKASVNISTLGSFDIPVMPLRNTTEFLKEYRSWVYACVRARAQDVSRLELRLYKITNRKTNEVREVMDHEVLSLLSKANPLMTFGQLIEYTQAFKDLAGEAFWYLQRSTNSRLGTITAIWILRPDYIDVKLNTDGTIREYQYRPPGSSAIPIAPEDMIHHREFNPLNPYRGMSVVEAAAMTIDQDNHAERYNTKFFLNNAAPGVVLSTEQKLDERIIKRMREQWLAEYGGPNKAGKLAILEGGLEVNPFTMTQRDMEFLASQQFTRDKIMALFQVPKTVLGMTENVTVSNAFATDLIFAKRVVKPLMQRLVDVLNEFLLPLYDEDLYFEFEDPTPEDRATQVDSATKLFGIGALSINEIREQEGRESIDNGDQHFIPFSLMPLDPAAADDTETPLPATDPVDGDSSADEKMGPAQIRKHVPAKHLHRRIREKVAERISQDITKRVHDAMIKTHNDFERTKQQKDLPISRMTSEQRDAHWKALVAKAERHEEKYHSIISQELRRQERTVLAHLDAAEKAVQKISPSDIDKILFDVNTETKITADLVLPFVSELMLGLGDDVLTSLGLKEQVFDITTESMKEFMRGRAVKGIKSMTKGTRAELRSVLTEAVREQLSIPETARKIKGVFDLADTTRAKRLARTEVLKASNRATLEAYKQSNVVVGKQWLTAMDERECEWCMRFDPQGGRPVVVSLESDFVDKGTDFTGSNGGTLHVDFDAIDTPPLHPNCRCTIVPVTLSEVNG